MWETKLLLLWETSLPKVSILGRAPKSFIYLLVRHHLKTFQHRRTFLNQNNLSLIQMRTNYRASMPQTVLGL